MSYVSRRPARAACAALLTCILLSACGGGGQENPKQQTVVAQTEPVTMVIQMTGLMLVVPPKQPNGLTHVLMPKMPTTYGMPDHLTFLGFKGPDKDCDGYDDDRGICYVNMKGWALDSIGKTASSSAGAGTAARGPLNLSRHTNRKIDLAQVRDSLVSEVTFARGRPTDSCGVAQWTYNPIGQDPPAKFEVINVLEWQIADMPADSFVLVRRELAAPYRRDTIAKIGPSDPVNNEIELLILNVLPDEAAELFRSARGVKLEERAGPGQVTTDAVGSDSTPERANAHFRRLYRLVGVPESMQRLPRRPVRIRGACPITVLDLYDQYAVDRENRFRRQDKDDSSARSRAGASTLSCVMASAEQI